ncbi:MAG: type II toxin-antitoxin system RelE/ParE family toxin [Sphingomonas taxi]
MLDIAVYYDRLDPALAENMVARVETATLPLLDFPRIGVLVDREGARKWRVPGTPFLLFYEVVADMVTILSVRHARSDWQLGS